MNTSPSPTPHIDLIPLDMIDDLPDHPFKVRMDEDMNQLIESIRQHGVITPIIVRPKQDGRYETISGHRRRKASELNGLAMISAEIRDKHSGCRRIRFSPGQRRSGRSLCRG